MISLLACDGIGKARRSLERLVASFSIVPELPDDAFGAGATEQDTCRLGVNSTRVPDIHVRAEGQRSPTTGSAWKRTFPDDLQEQRRELIGEVRRIMATVGIAALRPDLVVLDEFQRFKDLLQPEPDNFAADLAHRLFNFTDPETGRATRALLLSATPYRMYTTDDQIEGNHYEDFLRTCSFLLRDSAQLDRLRRGLNALRAALLTRGSLSTAKPICEGIGTQLRGAMARTERLSITPDRDGMLHELKAEVPVAPVDLRAYVRIGDLAESVEHHEPTEY